METIVCQLETKILPSVILEKNPIFVNENSMSEIKNALQNKILRNTTLTKESKIYNLFQHITVYCVDVEHFIDNFNFKLCGIYLIINRDNGKYYIGSSRQIFHRWHKHSISLQNNIHHNVHLQHATNKYGINKFEFIFLFTINPDKQYIIEQLFLDIANTEKEFSYNVSFIATGVEMNEFIKEKISIGVRAAYIRDPSISKKISEKQKLRYSLPGELLLLSQRSKQSYINNPQLAKNISLKTKQRFIDNPKLAIQLSKLAKQRYKENPELGMIISERNRSLFGGDGNPKYDHTTYNFYNIRTKELSCLTQHNFHIKYNISKSAINGLIKKSHKFLMNWVLIDHPNCIDNNEYMMNIMKKFTNKHIIHSFYNIVTKESFDGFASQFRKKHNLNQGMVSALILNKRVQHKSWILSSNKTSDFISKLKRKLHNQTTN